LGTDFDGLGDTLPTGLKDVSAYPNLIRVLLERGYSEQDIEKLCSGNVLRVWEKRKTTPASREQTPENERPSAIAAGRHEATEAAPRCVRPRPRDVQRDHEINGEDSRLSAVSLPRHAARVALYSYGAETRSPRSSPALWRRSTASDPEPEQVAPDVASHWLAGCGYWLDKSNNPASELHLLRLACPPTSARSMKPLSSVRTFAG
jgi:hypothetical protein